MARTKVGRVPDPACFRLFDSLTFDSSDFPWNCPPSSRRSATSPRPGELETIVSRPDLATGARVAYQKEFGGLRKLIEEYREYQRITQELAGNDELTREARTFFLRGVAMFRRRQYQAAMEAFIAALRFAPLPEVLYNMAVTAERLGSPQDAIDYYREYLRVRPDGPERGQIEQEIERLENGD